MGKVLCATRGGEASYIAQDAAIALAKTKGDELIFLYVADISFLDQMAIPLVVNVESRLEKLGHFQLVMAQERAAAQGIEAQAIVRIGHLRAELVDVAKEIGATIIVMGRSLGPESAFTDAAIKAFVADLQTETGVEVRILERSG
ncbi:MAG: universal stress protein [Thermoleophilia bacterium]|nr:universal stress protein [Thermoleophilia bacterium]